MEGIPSENERPIEGSGAEDLEVVAERSKVQDPPEAPDTSELLQRMKEEHSAAPHSETLPSKAQGHSGSSHGHSHDGGLIRVGKSMRGFIWLIGSWLFGGIKKSMGAKSEGGSKKASAGGHGGGHH